MIRRRPINLTQVFVSIVAIVLFASCLIAIIIVGLWILGGVLG